MEKDNFKKGEIVIYQSSKNEVKVEARIKKDTIWLTQNQIAILFGTQRPAITKHLNNIFKSQELNKNSVSSILEHTASDGKTYQTFGGKNLYPTIEDKASHLLYLAIKDHPFSDGNKRIASFLFVYFLDKSKYLYKKSGERKINDNALIALALLIAESDPKEKEVMVRIVKNLLIE